MTTTPTRAPQHEQKVPTAERFITKQVLALLDSRYINKKIADAKKKELHSVVLVDNKYQVLNDCDLDVPSLFNRCVLPDQTRSIKAQIEELVDTSVMTVSCDTHHKNRLFIELNWIESTAPVLPWALRYWMIIMVLLFLVKVWVLDLYHM